MTDLEKILRRALDALVREAPDDVDPEDLDELEVRLRAQGWRI